MAETKPKREPIHTRHTSVYNEVVARQNEAFRAGVEHTIAILAQFDEPAANHLEGLLFLDAPGSSQ